MHQSCLKSQWFESIPVFIPLKCTKVSKSCMVWRHLEVFNGFRIACIQELGPILCSNFNKMYNGCGDRGRKKKQQREIEKESDRKYENSNKIYHKLLFKFHWKPWFANPMIHVIVVKTSSDTFRCHAAKMENQMKQEPWWRGEVAKIKKIIQARINECIISFNKF